MYALQITHGNGYHCQCCRHEWEDMEEFETFDEAMKRIAKIEHVKENFDRMLELGLCGSNADDIRVSDFFEFTRRKYDQDAINQFKQEMKVELDQKESKAEAKKKSEEEAEAKQQEIDKRKQYEALKAEFESKK